MEESDFYIHGSEASEQDRLSILNAILNAQCLRKIGLGEESRILDVGSGLGQMSAMLAQSLTGEDPCVIGIERDARQLLRARKYLPAEVSDIVDFRQGDAYALPLSDGEWKSFDLVHCRFVLEHLREPQRAVDQMALAARPGGRIVLIDDDHTLFRLYPDLPVFTDVWHGYTRSYALLGNDPVIGRKLVTLLYQSGCRKISQDTIFFGSWSGNPHFHLYVQNMSGLLTGAEQLLLDQGIVRPGEITTCIKALQQWAELPDAAMWYAVNFAEGIR